MKRTHKRRKTIRLKEYDYSQPGAYFVTICTMNRQNLFGEIVGEEMVENEFGKIVRQCWNDLPDHYRNVELDAFVLMPNHGHGIITILDDYFGGARFPRPVTEETLATGRRPYRKPTLGNIVAYLKYQSAKQVNATRKTPGISIWQRGYYDHVIRNERSLDRIREYIRTNPQRWQHDKENALNEAKDTSDGWLVSQGKQAPQSRKVVQ